METVFSHVSKLELIEEAKQLGYLIRLTVIGTQDPRLNIARVQDRIYEGGHPVPIEKIISRYERSLPLLAQACRMADWASVRDNTSASEPFRQLLVFEDGEISRKLKSIPEWGRVFL